MTRPDKLVLATNNPKKLRELRRILEGASLDIEVFGLGDFERYPEPEEAERTFEGNAFLKAEAAMRATGLLAVADDSGLEVDELNGMPGVRSARWAGPACDDEDNNALLLAQLDGLPDERRSARFVCALAMVAPDGERRVWHGRMPGRINDRPAGENGFGYDPLFVPAGMTVTSSELTAEEKDSISHRGIAVRAFVDYLKELG
ncbi:MULTISPECIES: RdgB/HAM1 family non-canonical purine NTP pyrophosphatase [unclassified Tessaracoccus]|uniref:RdgB/HAM1 family non-canonical purine NTP pyrophosphatase n=1 Tax=unclassified Tessaracoccus TaxID=2635419 RepID=UPI00096D3D65|nr:RdgB/HAM1 family non-canonical purine NTP pyrophosphatase [Tessaracoccus sp. ZS01]MBB1509354.1 RdgB/HAM1 family non-canonical purine NTP pyrophosphatase [Tessaracoccus sp. MC1756]MCG6567078.1 non-canonical purine NTP pyrophosphatase, RdgB/HAM1 family [Tessaracoccus sp. ZS01]OMG57483.1 non-canonical purine NTP pyrophosphatase, RdgB/HAM1 family [Tessaracoccus sp. ZS01]